MKKTPKKVIHYQLTLTFATTIPIKAHPTDAIQWDSQLNGFVESKVNGESAEQNYVYGSGHAKLTKLSERKIKEEKRTKESD